MEPISILGVVGNTVQLIDFTAKLLSKTQSIHRSGSLLKQDNLLTVGNDLSHSSKALKVELNTAKSTLTENDRATSLLCQSCLEVAQEIEQALADMKKRPRDKWKSFRQALSKLCEVLRNSRDADYA